MNSLFQLCDSNKDGEIDLEEFIGAIYPVVSKAILKLTKGKQETIERHFRIFVETFLSALKM